MCTIKRKSILQNIYELDTFAITALCSFLHYLSYVKIIIE